MMNLQYILSVNIVKTLLFNFKLLPFRQAIHLPIVFYHNIKFVNLKGTVKFNTDNVSFRMVRIGAYGSDMFPGGVTTIDLKGELNFEGDGIIIGHGSLLRVEPDAQLFFSKNVIMGARNIIFCCTKIVLSKNTLFSWDCQILDSDTHHTKNLRTGMLKTISKPIFIGSQSWIGNHVMINKGTILPTGTIVSAMSLCNKDYSQLINKNSIIGGVPARILDEQIVRVD